MASKARWKLIQGVMSLNFSFFGSHIMWGGKDMFFLCNEWMSSKSFQLFHCICPFSKWRFYMMMFCHFWINELFCFGLTFKCFGSNKQFLFDHWHPSLHQCAHLILLVVIAITWHCFNCFTKLLRWIIKFTMKPAWSNQNGSGCHRCYESMHW